LKGLDQAMDQDIGESGFSVVQAQQGAKQLHLAPNQFRRNAEHMTEDEILGGVVAHAIRRRLALGLE